MKAVLLGARHHKPKHAEPLKQLPVCAAMHCVGKLQEAAKLPRRHHDAIRNSTGKEVKSTTPLGNVLLCMQQPPTATHYAARSMSWWCREQSMIQRPVNQGLNQWGPWRGLGALALGLQSPHPTPMTQHAIMAASLHHMTECLSHMTAAMESTLGRRA